MSNFFGDEKEVETEISHSVTAEHYKNCGSIKEGECIDVELPSNTQGSWTDFLSELYGDNQVAYINRVSQADLSKRVLVF